MNWFILTLLSQVFFVINAFVSKRFLNRSSLDPKIFGGISQLLVGLLALPIAIATGFRFQLTSMSVLLLLSMMVIYVVGTSFYFVGLKHVDISVTTILDASTSIWALLIGVFILLESFTTYKLAGLIFILSAVILVSIDPRSLRLRFNKFELFILLYAFMYAFGAAIDNQLVSFSNAISYLALSFTSVGSIMLLANYHTLIATPRKLIWTWPTVTTLLAIGGLSFAGFYCIMHAYELQGEISSMMPIQQLGGVIVPLIGIIFLHERTKVPQKLVAALLAFIGVILINR